MVRYQVPVCIVGDLVIKGTERISHTNKKTEKAQVLSACGLIHKLQWQTSRWARASVLCKGTGRDATVAKITRWQPCWFSCLFMLMWYNEIIDGSVNYTSEVLPLQMVLLLVSFKSALRTLHHIELKNNIKQQKMTFPIFSAYFLHLFDLLDASLRTHEVLTSQLWVTIIFLRWISHSCVLQWTQTK